MKSLTAS